MVTGTACFVVDRTICWGKHNYVGSWNDGDTSRDFQHKLANPAINLDGHGVVSDSAFPVSGRMFGKIMTPLKAGDLERLPPQSRGVALAMSDSLTSLRQACEWGMGAVEKVYQRLLLKLPYDQSRRSLRLNNIYRLYNYRVRTSGISEILNVFVEA